MKAKLLLAVSVVGLIVAGCFVASALAYRSQAAALRAKAHATLDHAKTLLGDRDAVPAEQRGPYELDLDLAREETSNAASVDAEALTGWAVAVGAVLVAGAAAFFAHRTRTLAAS